jgi:ribokinase
LPLISGKARGFVITIIGSINLDLVTTVDRLPEPGETVPGNGFRTAPGGKGANQALAAARAGVDVRLVGAVGHDTFAGEALALLMEGGVDLSMVRESNRPTGTAMILVGRDGENMIAVVPGANGAVEPSAIDELQLVSGEHVLLQHEIPLDTVAAALQAARAAGAVSLLNTAPFRNDAAELLTKADYVIANETEFHLGALALGLAGSDHEERMRGFCEKTGGTIIVTLGRHGVLAASPKQFLRVAALKIKPVDTVGAGDTFCGYFAAGLSSGLTLEEALRRAAGAGSLACLKTGAQQAIPFAPEVDEAIGVG